MTPDLEKLKALAEGALFDMTEKGYRSSVKISEFEMAANPTTILALLSHITRVEAERDVAHNAGYVSGFEQAELHFGGSIDAAFNDGVEAATSLASEDRFWTDGQCSWSVFLIDKFKDEAREITSPTTQPEDKS